MKLFMPFQIMFGIYVLFCLLVIQITWGRSSCREGHPSPPRLEILWQKRYKPL